MGNGIPMKVRHSTKFDGRSGQVEANIQIRITGLKQGEVGKVADAVVVFVTGLKGPESKASPEGRPQTIQFTSTQRQVIEGATTAEGAWEAFQEHASKYRRSIRTREEVVAYWRKMHPAPSSASGTEEPERQQPGLVTASHPTLPRELTGRERVASFSPRQRAVILGAATEDEAWDRFQVACEGSHRNEVEVRAMWRAMNIRPSEDVDWSKAQLSGDQRSLIQMIEKEDEIWPAFHAKFRSSLRGAEEVKAIWRALHHGRPAPSAPAQGAVEASTSVPGAAALPEAPTAPTGFKEGDRVLVARMHSKKEPYAATLLKVDMNSEQALIKGTHAPSKQRWVYLLQLTHDLGESPTGAGPVVTAGAKGPRAGPAGPVSNGVRQGSLVFNAKETETIYAAVSENDAVVKFHAAYGPPSTGKEGLVRAVWRVHQIAVAEPAKAAPVPEVVEVAGRPEAESHPAAPVPPPTEEPSQDFRGGDQVLVKQKYQGREFPGTFLGMGEGDCARIMGRNNREYLVPLWRIHHAEPTAAVGAPPETMTAEPVGLPEDQRTMLLGAPDQSGVWVAFHKQFPEDMKSGDEVLALWRELHPIRAGEEPGEGVGTVPEFKVGDRVLMRIRREAPGYQQGTVREIEDAGTAARVETMTGVRLVKISHLILDTGKIPTAAVGDGSTEVSDLPHLRGYQSERAKYGLSIVQAVFLRKCTCPVEEVYSLYSREFSATVKQKTQADIEGFYRSLIRMKAEAVAELEAAVAAVGRAESPADVVPVAPDLTGEPVTLEATVADPPPDAGTVQNPLEERVQKCSGFSRGQAVQLKDPAKRPMAGRGVVKRLDMISTMVMVRFRTGTKWYSPEEIEPHPEREV